MTEENKYTLIIFAVIAFIIVMGLATYEAPEPNPYLDTGCDRGLGYESC